jgi:hypothetical protein
MGAEVSAETAPRARAGAGEAGGKTTLEPQARCEAEGTSDVGPCPPGLLARSPAQATCPKSAEISGG